jgi:hypothetical protein
MVHRDASTCEGTNLRSRAWWQIAGLFGIQKLCVRSESSVRHLGKGCIESVVNLLKGE